MTSKTFLRNVFSEYYTLFASKTMAETVNACTEKKS